MHEREREEEHVIITRDGGDGSGFPLGLIAGLLIVILLIALIWFIGFGPGAAQQPGVQVDVNLPTQVPVNPYQSP